MERGLEISWTMPSLENWHEAVTVNGYVQAWCWDGRADGGWDDGGWAVERWVHAKRFRGSRAEMIGLRTHTLPRNASQKFLFFILDPSRLGAQRAAEGETKAKERPRAGERQEERRGRSRWWRVSDWRRKREGTLIRRC